MPEVRFIFFLSFHLPTYLLLSNAYVPDREDFLRDERQWNNCITSIEGVRAACRWVLTIKSKQANARLRTLVDCAHARTANYEVEISLNWVEINTFAREDGRQLNSEEVLRAAVLSRPDVEMKNLDRARSESDPFDCSRPAG